MEQIRNTVLQSLKKQINSEIVNTWFTPLEFIGCDESKRILYLHAPSKIGVEWIKDYYIDPLNQSLKDSGLTDYRINWTWN